MKYNRIIINSIIILSFILLPLSAYVIYNDNLVNESIENDFKGTALVSTAFLEFYDGHKEQRKLPAKISSRLPYKVTINLDEYDGDFLKSFEVVVKYCSLKCYCDEKVFYEYEPKSSILKSGGTSVHIIELPSDREENAIVLEFTPILDNINSHSILPIMFGRRINIILDYLLRKELLQIYFVLLLLVTFFVTSIVFIIGIRKKQFYRNLFNIGLLSLLLSIYFAGQLWTFNYFLGRYNILLYFLKYTTIMLAPIPVINLLKGKLNPKFDNMLDAGQFLAYINIIVQYVLLFIDVFEFRQMMIGSQIILGIDAIFVLVAVIFTRSNKFNSKKQIYFSLMPIVISLLIDFLIYIFYKPVVYFEILLLGIFIFMLIQIYQLLIGYINLRNTKIKQDLFDELSLVDKATGFYNRLSFSDELNVIDKEKRQLWIILIEFNDINYYIDKNGYEKTDELIVGVANKMTDIFKEYNNLKCFRVDVDEFFIFIYEGKQFDIQQLIKKTEGSIISELDHRMIFHDFYSYGYYYHTKRNNTFIDVSLNKVKDLMKSAKGEQYENI